MNKEKGFASIAIFLAIIVVLVAGGGAFWYYQNNSPVPASELDQDSSGQRPDQSEADSIQIADQHQVVEGTADWKTYRNEEYGFEFKYPEGWVIADDMYKDRIPPNVIMGIYLGPGAGVRGVTGHMNLFLKGYSDIDEQVDFNKKVSASVEEIEEFSSGEIRGRVIEASHLTGGQKDFIVYLEREGILVMIKFSQHDQAGFLSDGKKEQIISLAKTFAVFDDEKLNSKGEISPDGDFGKIDFKSVLDSQRIGIIKQVQVALELYYDAEGAYPDKLDQLVGKGIMFGTFGPGLLYYKCSDKKAHVGVNLDTDHPAIGTDADASNVCPGDMIKGDDGSGCKGESGLKCYDFVMGADY